MSARRAGSVGNSVVAPTAVRGRLARVHESLSPGGVLLLEVHTYESVVEEGSTPPGWYTSGGGLFSDRPHLVLVEHTWNAAAATAHTRYHVLDDAGASHEHAEALTAYRDDGYRRILLDAGFGGIEVMPGMGDARRPDMVVIAARTGPRR